MTPLSLYHFLALAAILFGLGVICVTIKRNAIGILMGIELILNAANINFIAFSHYVTQRVDGQVFAIFVIVLAASEAAIGFAIIYMLFKRFKTISAEKFDSLKG